MKQWTCWLVVVGFLVACGPAQEADEAPAATTASGKDENFTKVLEQHLAAVGSKDFDQLKLTVPQTGELVWILPNGASFMKAEEFLQNHEEWFQDTSWTMTTRIVQSDWGTDHGTAIVEADLREPERNGKPYFHRMYISYGLKKMNDGWKVVLDHASTIEKSE